MKNLLIVALALVPTLAFAEVKVGTGATFDVTMANEKKEELKGALVIEVTDYNEENKSFEVTQALNMGGEPQVQKDWNLKSELDQAEKEVAELVANCAAMGGTPEKLTTAMGELDTCKAVEDSEQSTDTTWYANVPFFTAQYSSVNKENGTSVSFTIKSVK
jgi:hypothetical protein